MKCIVYRSIKKEGYYLYVAFGTKLNELPKELLDQLGQLKQIMLLDLERKTNLRQIEPEKLISILQDQKYFLYIQSPQVVEQIIEEHLNRKAHE